MSKPKDRSASPTRTSKALGGWLSDNTRAKTVTLTLVPGATNAFNGYNFNGYGRGAVLVDVPLGWRVTVRCNNDVSNVSHSCAIVRDGGNATAPIFPGAASPDPQTGLPPGHSAQFSFVATRPGAYRIACLIPEHETMGMWDGFEISSSQRPSVRQVRSYGDA
jgi:FtsP/CotA-like multicopper oxidase with cupredoxin domain